MGLEAFYNMNTSAQMYFTLETTRLELLKWLIIEALRCLWKAIMETYKLIIVPLNIHFKPTQVVEIGHGGG